MFIDIQALQRLVFYSLTFSSQKNRALNRPRVTININVYLIFYCLISLEGVKTMPIVLLFKAYKLHASLPN